MNWRLLALLPLLVAGCSAARMAAWAEGPDDEPAPLIAMGDFNHDGIADLAMIAPAAGEDSTPRLLTLLLGHGDGTFRPAAAVPLPGRDPRSIVVGDFNGDGRVDVIVGDWDGSLVEFRGDGRGNLAPAGEIGRLDSVVSIAVGDFNHDGVPDLAISDSHANRVTMLLGDGHGDFQMGWSFTTPKIGGVFHLAVADFNGDGIPDLAVANEDQDTFDVMLGNGNGTFTYAPTLSKVMDAKAHCAT